MRSIREAIATKLDAEAERARIRWRSIEASGGEYPSESANSSICKIRAMIHKRENKEENEKESKKNVWNYSPRP